MSEAVLVVPCFNEARRLQGAELARLAETPGLGLLLVDDGSTDDTRALLSRLASASSGKIEVLALPHNQGKAEAVRRGMREGLASGAGRVGYFDADLATPVDELLRLLRALEQGEAAAVMGARIARSGADIHRHLWRHLTGRVFATAASLALRKPFYDTQCGAKIFRATPALREALSEPFCSRWAFDVELLGRLLTHAEPGNLLEVPLDRWIDVDGSKLRLRDMLRSGTDLLQINRALSKRRARLK